MYDDDFGYEPYEDDLQTFSDNEAWEDAQADMRDYEEDSDCPDEDGCSCHVERYPQYDAYGIYAGKMCDHCFVRKYRQDRYFDPGFAGESLEPEEY